MSEFFVAGVVLSSGVSTKTGSPVPYSMAEVAVLMPGVPVNSQNRKVSPIGFPMLVNLSIRGDDTLPLNIQAAFNSIGGGQPCFMDFKTSMNHEGKTIITGYDFPKTKQ